MCIRDSGTISDAAGTVVARVVDVQRAPNGQALHTVEVEGELVVGANYKLEIDHTRRHRVMKNHTATHPVSYTHLIISKLKITTKFSLSGNVFRIST